MNNLELVKTLSNLLKTNKGFFKSEKQAKFLLHTITDFEVVNYFDAYGNPARDHYYLDDQGVYKIERYTNKKGYVITWERGKIHRLEADMIKMNQLRSITEVNQINKLGYVVTSECYNNFITLFDKYKCDKFKLETMLSFGDDLQGLVQFLTQYNDYVSAVETFKSVYNSCNF